MHGLAGVRGFALVCVSMHGCSWACACVLRHAQVCTNVCGCALVCAVEAGVQRCSQACEGGCSHVLRLGWACMGVCRHVCGYAGQLLVPGNIFSIHF